MAPKKAMTKAQLVAALAEKAGLSKKQVGEVLATLADLACKEAKVGFTIPGIGKLVVGFGIFFKRNGF